MVVLVSSGQAPSERQEVDALGMVGSSSLKDSIAAGVGGIRGIGGAVPGTMVTKSLEPPGCPLAGTAWSLSINSGNSPDNYPSTSSG